MKDLKSQLIRLGNTNPELRKHLRPVLDRIAAWYSDVIGHYQLEADETRTSVIMEITDLRTQEKAHVEYRSSGEFPLYEVFADGRKIMETEEADAVSHITHILKKDDQRFLGNLNWQ